MWLGAVATPAAPAPPAAPRAPPCTCRRSRPRRSMPACPCRAARARRAARLPDGTTAAQARPRRSRPGTARAPTVRATARSSRCSPIDTVKITGWQLQGRQARRRRGSATTRAARSPRKASTRPASRTATGASSRPTAPCSASTTMKPAPASRSAGSTTARSTASATLRVGRAAGPDADLRARRPHRRQRRVLRRQARRAARGRRQEHAAHRGDFGCGTRVGPRQIWQFWELDDRRELRRHGKLDGAFTMWRDRKIPRVQGTYDHGKRTGDVDVVRSREQQGARGRLHRRQETGAWYEWTENKLVFSGNYTRRQARRRASSTTMQRQRARPVRRCATAPARC